MRIFGHSHHQNTDPWADAPAYAVEIGAIGITILETVEKIMATLDQVLQDVTDESTQIDGLSTLIAGLKQQVSDALSGANLPPATQAKVDQIFAAAESNKSKIATALNTGTPQAPAQPPATPST
jgi:altronate dehydratase